MKQARCVDADLSLTRTLGGSLAWSTDKLVSFERAAVGGLCCNGFHVVEEVSWASVVFDKKNAIYTENSYKYTDFADTCIAFSCILGFRQSDVIGFVDVCKNTDHWWKVLAQPVNAAETDRPKMWQRRRAVRHSVVRADCGVFFF